MNWSFAFRIFSLLFCFAVYSDNAANCQVIPSSLPGLALWLDSENGVVLNGSNVAQWNDQSGNGNDFIAVNPSFEPNFVATSSLNNKPYLNFDGTDRMESISNFSLSDASIFVVATLKSGNGGNFRLLDHDYLTGFWMGRGAVDGVGGGFKDGSSPFGNFRIFSANTSFIYSMIRNGSVASSFFNSANFPIPSRTTVGGATASNKIALCSTLDGVNLGLWNIYEIIIYDNDLNSADRLDIEKYLRDKYAPPISLGPDVNTLDFCALNIAAPAGFSNINWSTGATTPFISITQSGSYWVEGTDVFGFITRDTIVVNFPIIQTPTTTGICVNQSITWDPQLDPTYSYLWSTGATSTTLNISTAGPYSVQVTDGLGCTANSNTLNFTVDTYEQTAFLGNDTSLCIGNLIALQVGAAETVSYLWPDASSGSNYAVDTTGNYFVEVTNSNGCVAQDTILITIAGQAPTADFSFSNECNGAINNFGDLSVPSGMDALAIWSWDLGDGNNSSALNPSHVYLTPGTYDVELYVESIGGCGAFHTETVEIYDLPIAGFSVLGHCSDQDVFFTNTSNAGTALISDYYWDFDMPATGAYNNSVAISPDRIFADPGSYDVSMVVNDFNGCKDTIVQTIVIDESPLSIFTAPDVCQSQSIPFNNLSTGVSLTYLWDFGDATFSILSSPIKSFTTFGSKDISLIVTAANGCKDTSELQVYVNPNPIVSFTYGPHCFGSYMELDATTTIPEGSINSNMWVANSLDTVYGDPAFYLIDLIGQNQVVLTSTSGVGCSSSASQFIMVTDTLIASYSAGTGIVAIGDPIQFVNTSIGDDIWLWNFGDGSFSTDENPSHIYNSTLVDSTAPTYLIAINAAGCIDTAYYTVQIATASLDLELQTLFLQEDNGFYIVGVKLVNQGTRILSSADLQLWTQQGLLFNEKWTGSLLPTQSIIYVFESEPYLGVSTQDIPDAFICVEGLGFDVDGNAENYLLNNKVCRNIEGENVIMLPVHPNPVGTNLEVELIVSLGSTVDVALYDSRGRLVKSIVVNESLETGLYTYSISLKDVEAGTYFLRMISGEMIIQEKLLLIGE